jgi:YD repeat-containing protein
MKRSEQDRLRATLHDAVGRLVGVLDAGEQQAGTHRLSWDRDNEGRKLSAGAYFVLLDMGMEKARLKAVVK